MTTYLDEADVELLRSVAADMREHNREAKHLYKCAGNLLDPTISDFDRDIYLTEIAFVANRHPLWRVCTWCGCVRGLAMAHTDACSVLS